MTPSEMDANSAAASEMDVEIITTDETTQEFDLGEAPEGAS